MAELNVVYTYTTDSVKLYRLSKQAKDFLKFLVENNIDGSIFSSKEHENSPDFYPEIGVKDINNEYVWFYRKGISLIRYIDLNRDKFPNHKLFVSSITGNLSTHNSSLRNSLNRTINRLWKWRLIERFSCRRFYGAKHYYFITLKGKHVLELKLGKGGKS